MACAAVSGVASSLVGCPAELVMIHQQKSGGSLVAVAKDIIQNDGARTLYRGWVRMVTSRSQGGRVGVWGGGV
eukprot:88367-Pyramimonas_sp.AAC.1